MKKLLHLAKTTALVSILLIALPTNAHAYLDPGSGSYFLQWLIAALLGAAFTIKTFGRTIKTFIKNNPNTKTLIEKGLQHRKAFTFEGWKSDMTRYYDRVISEI